MVEFLVLLIRLQSQLPVNLVQRPEEWPHKLHPAHLSQQLSNQRVCAGDLGTQGDSEVGRLQLYVLALEEFVYLAQLLSLFGTQGFLEGLDLAKEDKLLVGVKALNVFGRWLEVLVLV